MASLVNDPGGRKRIVFVAPDESRKAIRMGKLDRKSADGICRHVEALLAAKIGGQPVPRDMAVWLTEIGAVLRDKLLAVELVEPLQRLTAGEFLTSWLAGKKAAGHKPTSLRAWGQTVAALVEQFGKHPLASLAHADGEAFRSAMQGRGLRATTIHKRLGHARQMLEDALRLGHITANPLKHVRQRSGDPAERRAYVTIADAERVIEHCPNVWWRLLTALPRFAGLRVPSEAFSLTWRDVDWERGRLSVPSPKPNTWASPIASFRYFRYSARTWKRRLSKRPRAARTFSRTNGERGPRVMMVGPAPTCGRHLPRSCARPAWNLGRGYGIRCGHRANRTWPKASH
jgi:integrase